MFEIGNSLREARLRQQLQFSVLEERTKVRPKYLRALEDEQFEVLPAPTYVKGFLKAYADALGLDGQLYVDEFDSRFVAGEEDAPFRAQRSASTRAARRVETSAVLVTLAAIGILTALLVLAFKTPDSRQAALRRREGNGTACEDPGARRAQGACAAGGARPDRGKGPVLARGRAGSSSGVILFSGTLAQGKSLPFVAKRLWVSAGALGNLQAKVNGHIATLVGSGSPATLVFSPHGQLTG